MIFQEYFFVKIFAILALMTDKLKTKCVMLITFYYSAVIFFLLNVAKPPTPRDIAGEIPEKISDINKGQNC